MYPLHLFQRKKYFASNCRRAAAAGKARPSNEAVARGTGTQQRQCILAPYWPNGAPVLNRLVLSVGFLKATFNHNKKTTFFVSTPFLPFLSPIADPLTT